MRTQPEWDYTGCIQKLHLLDGDLEKKVGRNDSSGNFNLIHAQYWGKRPKKYL